MAKTFLTNINLKGNQLLNAVIHSASSAPSALAAGQLYFNTTNSTFYYSTGTGTGNWEPVGVQYISAVGTNLSVTGGELDLGANVVITDSTQTLSNKTILGPLYFTDNVTVANEGEIVINSDNNNFEITAVTNDLVLGSNNGNIILSANSDIYKGSINANNKIATVGTTQTFDSKTLTNTTLGGDLDADSLYTIKNLVDPTNAQDAATKAYVDATAQGLSVLGSVRYASTANFTLGINASGGLDGVVPANGDRVLLKNQNDATENGIYIYSSMSQTLVASDDVEDTDIKQGTFVFITEGGQGHQGWIVTSYTAGASTWTQFSAAGEYTAGNGIDIDGQSISVKLDSDSLSKSTSGLKVNLAENGGLNNDGGLYVNTGTGIIVDNSNYLRLDTSNGYGVRKYAETITPVTPFTETSFAITHDFDTNDVITRVYQAYGLDSGVDVEVDIKRTSSNVVTVSFASAPAAGETYAVVIIG